MGNLPSLYLMPERKFSIDVTYAAHITNDWVDGFRLDQLDRISLLPILCPSSSIFQFTFLVCMFVYMCVGWWDSKLINFDFY